MDRESLLKNLGLSEDELTDFLKKFVNFERLLNAAQLKVLVRSLPNLEQARKSFCPKPEDLAELFREEELVRGEDTVLCYFAGDGGGGN